MALDPRQARIERERKKARENPDNVPLNPPFPFTNLPFDPFFFSATIDPKPEEPPTLGSGRL